MADPALLVSTVPEMARRELSLLSKDDLMAVAWAMASWGPMTDGPASNAYRYSQLIGCYKILARQLGRTPKSVAGDYPTLGRKTLAQIEAWIAAHPEQRNDFAAAVDDLKEMIG